MAQAHDFPLPENLTAPIDDGAANHLVGLAIPSIALPSTKNRFVDLSQATGNRIIIYCYPMTGVPGKALPAGWDEIPGARGCTPQTCGFRDHHQELTAFGADVFGLSTQSTAYQQEMAARLHLPFEVLSDDHFKLTDALQLPTFEAGGMRLLKRVTLVVSDGRIEHIFYPVFPPDRSAAEVLEWFAKHRTH